MNDQKLNEKPEEYFHIKQLVDEGKHDEALLLMENFEENGDRPLHEIISCHLLKCDLLFQQGSYENVVKLAEQTYKESLGLGKNILSFEALNYISGALIYLYRLDKAFEMIKQEEELLKTFTNESPTDYKQREWYIAFHKGAFYDRKREPDRAFEYYEYSLALGEELGAKPEIVMSLIGNAWILGVYKGELDRALKYLERGLTIAEESNKIKWHIAWISNVLAILYGFKGELDRSIMLNEQSLVIYNDLNNKERVVTILNNMGNIYRMKGELDRALEYLEQSLALRYEMGNLRSIAVIYDSLIRLLIEKGDLELAQQCLHSLELMSSRLKDERINLYYLFNKALILKTSPRAFKRGKAEELLKKILKYENLSYEHTIRALLNLCELLLIELRMINDIEMLDEINPLIARLLDIAEKSKSYWILSETYLLQAKLSLLSFNIKEAKRFLTQARQIAERFGLNQLAVKISSENDDLLKKLDLWEKLKEINAPMADRLELARLDEKLVGMIQKRPVLITQLTEEKVAVTKEKKICLVCRGEVLRFSYICECGAIYCENCARAIIDLENVCWACDAPIDYLKPVILYKEGERVKVEEEAKKKQSMN